MVDLSTRSEVIWSVKPAHNGETLMRVNIYAWAIPWEVQTLIFGILKQRMTRTLLVYGVLTAIIGQAVSG